MLNDREGKRPAKSRLQGRKLRCFLATIALTASLRAQAADETARFSAELELGAVWQSRNNVQIPNDANGTRFSLRDLAGSGPWPAGRFHFTWNVSGRHGLSLLLAPLSYTETGTFEEPVQFAGGSFVAGQPTRATYQFNSWRIGYRYQFHDSSRWQWWAGFTAKVRDAKISLEQGGSVSEDKNLGFVPLAYIAGAWQFSDQWSLLLDLDAIAGGPGRAEDFSVKLSRKIGDRWNITGGYRTVEGGADVDDVYNFAWLNYAVVSARVQF